jgi:hypothetical protein
MKWSSVRASPSLTGSPHIQHVVSSAKDLSSHSAVPLLPEAGGGAFYSAARSKAYRIRDRFSESRCLNPAASL